MSLRLADGVHAAQIGSDFVFLDPRRDDYLCLPLETGTLALEGDQLVTAFPELRSLLLQAGLATVSGCAARATTAPTSPRHAARRLIEDTPGLNRQRPRPRQVWALAVALATAVLGRGRPVLTLAQGIRRPDRPAPAADLLPDLAVYRRLAPWLPIDGLCLFRSHMLLTYLNRLGHDPRWMFGVRTWPFRAHCWLQQDDVALDDEAERLAAYTPIMAV